jgi:hypothetical protein
MDHDSPRWGGHTSTESTVTFSVLGAPTSIMGSELSSLLGSGLLHGSSGTWVSEAWRGIRSLGGKDMPTYMVSYDLKTQGKDYSALIKALQEGYRSYWHCLDSIWLIVADQNHTQVRDYLVQHIDDNDQLIVADLGGNAAWHGFSEECSNWITNNLQA